MNIALFDDQIYIARELSNSFNILDNSIFICWFDESAALLKHIEKSKPEIIVLDLMTSEELGVQLIDKVAQLCPNAYIVVYSVVTLPIIQSCILEAGAHFFINKKIPPNKAAEMILENKTSFQPLLKEGKPITIAFSKKEKTIVNLMVEGLSASDIAIITKTSINTINNQKNKLIKKFSCNSSTELVVKLTRLGYVKI